MKTKTRGHDGTSNLCVRCHKRRDSKYTDDNFALPTWHEISKEGDTIVHYDLPEELRNLMLAEKLLIQRLSPIIPLVHLKHGVYGSKGHVCTFPKDIGPICNVLPRLPQDITVIRVVRHYKNRNGQNVSRAFNVRRNKVLRALRWLKRYSSAYRDIKIEESNLDWMQGEQISTVSLFLFVVSCDKNMFF
jgi:hypothetical protein